MIVCFTHNLVRLVEVYVLMENVIIVFLKDIYRVKYARKFAGMVIVHVMKMIMIMIMIKIFFL